MSDFDEMRLVFKEDAGYVWRCPCGLGAKSAAGTAGKARIGARDHINRRHPRAAPPEETPALPALGRRRGRLARTATPVQDRSDLLDAVTKVLERNGLSGRIHNSREFQQRVGEGLEPGLDAFGARIGEDYGFVDDVILVRAPALRPAQWFELVELLERRGLLVLYDLAESAATEGGHVLLMGATQMPDVRCQAYAAPDRRGAYRPCANGAEHLVVAGVGIGPRARVALCKLHLRTHGDGMDLGRHGGDALVEFRSHPVLSAESPMPADAVGGVRPAAPKPWPVLRMPGVPATPANAEPTSSS